MVTLCTAAAAEANPDPGISQAGAAGIGGGRGAGLDYWARTGFPPDGPSVWGLEVPTAAELCTFECLILSCLFNSMTPTKANYKLTDDIRRLPHVQ